MLGAECFLCDSWHEHESAAESEEDEPDGSRVGGSRCPSQGRQWQGDEQSAQAGGEAAHRGPEGRVIHEPSPEESTNSVEDGRQ